MSGTPSEANISLENPTADWTENFISRRLKNSASGEATIIVAAAVAMMMFNSAALVIFMAVVR